MSNPEASSYRMFDSASKERNKFSKTGVAALVLLGCLFVTAAVLHFQTSKRLTRLEMQLKSVLVHSQKEHHKDKSVTDSLSLNKRADITGEEHVDTHFTLAELADLDLLKGNDGRDGRDGRDCVFNSSLIQLLIDQSKESILEQVDQKIAGSQDTSNSAAVSSGSSYIHWGSSTCDGDTTRIYSGFAAGQYFTQSGGSANYQCLPSVPEYGNYSASHNSGNWIFAAEYETFNDYRPELMHQDTACSMCYTPRSAVMTLPARTTCPSGWTMEYQGYLMSGAPGDNRAYVVECVDKKFDYILGRSAHGYNAAMTFIQGYCPNLTCPPYIQAAELSCVVCSK